MTTIPAAAYAGVAAGLGQGEEFARGLAVLGVNVITLLVTGTATLVIQRSRGSAADSSRATSRRQSSR